MEGARAAGGEADDDVQDAGQVGGKQAAQLLEEQLNGAQHAADSVGRTNMRNHATNSHTSHSDA